MNPEYPQLPKRKKPLKDKDLQSRITFLFFFLRLLPFCNLAFIGAFTYWVTVGTGGERFSIGTLTLLFLATLAAGVVAALILSLLIEFFLDRTGSGLVNMAMGIRSVRNRREQRGSDLDRVRYLNRNRRFDEALTIISDVLEEDEEYPEALALRAQAWHEGSNRTDLAVVDLRLIMKITPANDPQHRWAADYYKKISGASFETTKRLPKEPDKNGQTEDVDRTTGAKDPENEGTEE